LVATGIRTEQEADGEEEQVTKSGRPGAMVMSGEQEVECGEE